MRKIVYKIAGVETTDYAEKVRIEKQYGLKCETELRKCDADETTLTPKRKAMLEQFGYAHKSLKDKVQLG